METPGRPVALGPVGGALRDPARRHPDPRLDPRLPPRARLGDDLRWGTHQPVRALGPDAVRPRRRGRHQDRLGDHHSDSRRSSHGLLQDRSLYQRSIGYAPAPEGDARAEPVARRGDRLATRTDDRDPRPPHASYLLVAENWYPDWQATVDGGPAQVLRGDYSLLTVALPAGAKVVDLTFRSKLYELGRTLTLASLAVLLIALLAALTLPRRAPHG